MHVMHQYKTFFESTINTMKPHRFRRRPGLWSKRSSLLLWGTVLLSPSSFIHVQRWILLCSSFSIKASITTSSTTTKLPITSIVYTSFQFDSNGTCIVPKYFVTGDTSTTAANEESKKSGNYFTMQNVPGDGDCMFLAVALAATQSTSITTTIATSMNHIPVTPIPYYNISHTRSTTHTTTTAMTLRNVVADILQQPNCTLYISQNRTIMSHDLLQQASNELHVLPSKYIELLRSIGGLYGGGPELTILCNVYQRPIHIYEIDYDKININAHEVSSNSSSCSNINQGNDNLVLPIIERGVFGQGVYDIVNTTTITTTTASSSLSIQSSNDDDDDGNNDWGLHILVVDVSVSEKHACTLFPVH